MAPRKKAEAQETAAPTELTEENIDDLDDEALTAAMEAMEAGDATPDAADEIEAAPAPAEAKETAKAEDAEGDGEAGAAKPDEQPAKAPEQTIPKSRLDKEVAVRKAAEERAEQMQKRFDQLLEMRGKGEEKPKQEEAEPEQWIDPKKDIFGAYSQLQKLLSDVVNNNNQQYQQTEQQRQVQTLIAESDADIEAYRSEAPDIDDAIAFLRESRKQELAVYGITDPRDLRQDLSQAQLAITQQAKQMGVRPAQLLYQIAGTRGYQPKAPEAKQEQGGKPTASAKDPSQLIDDVNKLEATKQRSQSLGGSGAPVEVSGITMQDLATMPEADFKKLAKLAEEKGVDVLELVSG